MAVDRERDEFSFTRAASTSRFSSYASTERRMRASCAFLLRRSDRSERTRLLFKMREYWLRREYNSSVVDEIRLEITREGRKNRCHICLFDDRSILTFDDSAFSLAWIDRRVPSNTCNSSRVVSGLSIRSRSRCAAIRDSWMEENSSLMDVMKKRMISFADYSQWSCRRCSNKRKLRVMIQSQQSIWWFQCDEQPEYS